MNIIKLISMTYIIGFILFVPAYAQEISNPLVIEPSPTVVPEQQQSLPPDQTPLPSFSPFPSPVPTPIPSPDPAESPSPMPSPEPTMIPSPQPTPTIVPDPSPSPLPPDPSPVVVPGITQPSPSPTPQVSSTPSPQPIPSASPEPSSPPIGGTQIDQQPKELELKESTTQFHRVLDNTFENRNVQSLNTQNVIEQMADDAITTTRTSLEIPGIFISSNETPDPYSDEPISEEGSFALMMSSLPIFSLGTLLIKPNVLESIFRGFT